MSNLASGCVLVYLRTDSCCITGVARALTCALAGVGVQSCCVYGDRLDV